MITQLEQTELSQIGQVLTQPGNFLPQRHADGVGALLITDLVDVSKRRLGNLRAIPRTPALAQQNADLVRFGGRL